MGRIFKIIAGSFQTGSHGIWGFDHFKLKSEGRFLREKLDLSEIQKLEALDGSKYPSYKKKVHAMCVFKDGRTFLSILPNKLFEQIQTSIFNHGLGKKVSAPFPYRKWRLWEKIMISTIAAPCLAFILLVVIMALLHTGTASSTDIEEESVASFGQAYAKNIQIRSNWQNVDADGDGKSLRFTIWYKRPPSLSEAKADTVRMTNAVLLGLLARGHAPAAEWISIHVHARALGQGATGAGLGKYGSAEYDFSRDKITFDYSD